MYSDVEEALLLGITSSDTVIVASKKPSQCIQPSPKKRRRSTIRRLLADLRRLEIEMRNSFWQRVGDAIAIIILTGLFTAGIMMALFTLVLKQLVP